jgi:aryl-alcohol dehydrogenase
MASLQHGVEGPGDVQDIRLVVDTIPMNALNVRPGTSFACFGAGAAGCSAIMAARVVGATTIVAIDIVPSRLGMAEELGATHAINSKQTNPVEAIRDITGGGVDYSLETSGDPIVLHQAIEALGSLGTCGIVGAEPLGTEVSFDVNIRLSAA